MKNKFMNIIERILKSWYQILLTFNSIALIGVIYLIKEGYVLAVLIDKPIYISHILFMIFPFVLTYIVILSKTFLSKDIINDEITGFDEVNNGYLPSYLGYFFVALSVPNNNTFFFVFITLFIFIYFSHTLYFNPLFLVYRYKFYYIELANGSKNIVISKRIFRTKKDIAFQKLRRINYSTYIDEEVN